MTTADVVIVGGGVVGLTTAFRCAQRGLDVLVFEAGSVGREASWAGAGMIPPGDLAGGSMDYHRLTQAASQMWPELSAELHSATGLQNGYSVCGSLHPVSTTSFSDSDTQQPLESQLLQWHQLGVEAEHLDETALHQRCPQFDRRWNTGLWFPTAAQVRNPWHLQALKAYCLKCGVRFFEAEPVRKLDQQNQQSVAVYTDLQTVSAANVVLTAGAWSNQVLESVGCQLPVKPLRGQIALLKAAEPLFDSLIECGKQYLVPRDDGHILIGSTEEDAGYEKITTEQQIAALLEFASSLLPELARLQLVHQWAGLRPVTPDGMPVLGAIPGHDTLWIATGHSRAGLTLSPVTALLMTQLITREVTSLDIEPFRLERFGNRTSFVSM